MLLESYLWRFCAGKNALPICPFKEQLNKTASHMKRQRAEFAHMLLDFFFIIILQAGSNAGTRKHSG